MPFAVRLVLSFQQGKLVSETVAATLRYVPSLEEGKTTAVDYASVLSVAVEIVNKTLPYCSHPIISDMAQVQMFAGMRPQDICNMRLCDIDRTGKVWEYTPWEHKTDHLHKRKARRENENEKKLIRWLGPKAQEILTPYVTAKEVTPDAFLFSPADGIRLLKLENRMNRKSRVQPSQENRSKPNPKKKPGLKYTTASYGAAIKRACKKAGVEEWSPNQLRHTWATYVEKKYGADAARIILGHTNVDTTLIYIERDNARGREIAKEIG